MVELIEQQSGQRPEAILADNGYCSEQNLEHLESAEGPERKIEGFNRNRQAKAWRASPAGERGPLPKGATRVDRMKRKPANQGGQSRLRGAQMRGGTGVRADQASAWISSILAARKKESESEWALLVPDP